MRARAGAEAETGTEMETRRGRHVQALVLRGDRHGRRAAAAREDALALGAVAVRVHADVRLERAVARPPALALVLVDAQVLVAHDGAPVLARAEHLLAAGPLFVARAPLRLQLRHELLHGLLLLRRLGRHRLELALEVPRSQLHLLHLLAVRLALGLHLPQRHRPLAVGVLHPAQQARRVGLQVLVCGRREGLAVEGGGRREERRFDVEVAELVVGSGGALRRAGHA